MNVIKVINGVVSQYSIKQLKADNPNVCFPKNISASILSSYDVYEYIDDAEPSYNEDTHSINESYVYELDNKWHKTKTVVQLSEGVAARNIRRTRDSLIAQTDWLGASDVTMSTEWSTYRQALRDIPQQSGFPFNVTYPTNPNEIEIGDSK
jgi:hypothetical protein